MCPNCNLSNCHPCCSKHHGFSWSPKPSMVARSHQVTLLLLFWDLSSATSILCTMEDLEHSVHFQKIVVLNVRRVRREDLHMPVTLRQLLRHVQVSQPAFSTQKTTVPFRMTLALLIGIPWLSSSRAPHAVTTERGTLLLPCHPLTSVSSSFRSSHFHAVRTQVQGQDISVPPNSSLPAQ